MNSRHVQTSSKDMPLRAKDHNKQSLRPLAFPLSLPFHLPTAPACNETIGTSHCGPYMSLHYTSPSNCCTAMANRPFARAWSRSCSTFLLNVVVICLKPQNSWILWADFGWMYCWGLNHKWSPGHPLRLWPHAVPHPGDSPQGAPVVRWIGNQWGWWVEIRIDEHLPKNICKHPIQTNYPKHPIQTNDPKSIAPYCSHLAHVSCRFST